MKYSMIFLALIFIVGCVAPKTNNKKEIEMIDQSTWFSSGVDGEKLEPMEECLTQRVKKDGFWTMKAEADCTREVEKKNKLKK